jgi:flagellar hook-basal body complex protein FliE
MVQSPQCAADVSTSAADPMSSPITGLGPGRIGLDIAGEGGARKPASLPTAPGASFADTLKQAINGVQDSQDNAADYVGKFMRGENVELHQVMAATEEASISLETLVELRNKFTAAYQSVISMQS